MANKENPIIKFIKDLFKKIDQKMLEKAKERPCCCKDKGKGCK